MPWNTIEPYVVALSTTIPATALAWLKIFDTIRKRRAFFAERAHRFNELVTSGRWRHVSPMELESAYKEGTGRSLDARILRAALEREDTSALLDDLQQCKGMVVMAADGRFARTAGVWFRRWSDRRQAQLLVALSFVPGLLFFVMTYPSHLVGHPLTPALVFQLLWSAGTCVLGITVAGWLESAHRVVVEQDERHPHWSTSA